MDFIRIEKNGTHRTIHFCGLKFKYNKGRKYTYVPVTTSGITMTKRNTKLIVSLTSFPPRIPYVHITITSLLQQTVKPDMVILWLAKEQFPNLEKDLPNELIRLQEFGLSIMWYHDVKPYKKLIPTLINFPDDIIITVDDDVFYDETLVERLYKSYEKYPEYIHCHRITKIMNKNGNFNAKIKKCYKKPSFANKLVGIGGVLYPPHSLYKDVTDEKLFMELAPTNDDIWFWIMAVLNDTRIMQIKNNTDEPAKLEETLNGPCLCKVNDHGENLFYIQLEKVISHYKGLREKIIEDMN